MSLFPASGLTAEPRRRDESLFDFVARSSSPFPSWARQQLEAWFERYPAERRSHLAKQMRAKDGSAYHGAALELFAHELASRIGARPFVVPPADDSGVRTPDFELRGAAGTVTVLEATSTSDAEDPAEWGRQAAIAQTVRGLHSAQFVVRVIRRGRLDTDFNLKQLGFDLRKFLRSDEVVAYAAAVREARTQPQPKLSIKVGKAELVFLPVVRRDAAEPATNSLLDWWDMPVPVQTVESVRGAVLRKAKRYGNLNGPYVVVVSVLGERGMVDEDEVVSALYGDGDFRSRALAGRQNGVWTSAKYRGLSAVLVVAGPVPAWDHDGWFTLFRNPWATYPVDGALLSLPRCELEGELLQFHPGSAMAAIFATGDSSVGTRLVGDPTA